MRRIVREAGNDARFTDVLATVRAACAAIDVRAPSSGMVHREMMRARQLPAADAATTVDDIAVTVVSCLLPVTMDDHTIDALDLVIAVERPRGRIVGYRLVLEGDRTSAARNVLAVLTEIETIPVTVSSLLADAVGNSVAEHGRPHPDAGAHGVGVAVAKRATLLSTTLGNYIDSISIRHRRVTSQSPGPWRQLTAEDALTAMRLAVTAHNTARGA